MSGHQKTRSEVRKDGGYGGAEIGDDRASMVMGRSRRGCTLKGKEGIEDLGPLERLGYQYPMFSNPLRCVQRMPLRREVEPGNFGVVQCRKSFRSHRCILRKSSSVDANALCFPPVRVYVGLVCGIKT